RDVHALVEDLRVDVAVAEEDEHLLLDEVLRIEFEAGGFLRALVDRDRRARRVVWVGQLGDADVVAAVVEAVDAEGEPAVEELALEPGLVADAGLARRI